MAVAGLLTLLVCAGTVVPLYVLARTAAPARTAWSTAALWPLVPAALLFHPTADTAYPFLAATVLALAALAARGRALWAVFAGLGLGLGTQFSLAFVPIGLIVALMLVFLPGPACAQAGKVGCHGFRLGNPCLWAPDTGSPSGTRGTHHRFHKKAEIDPVSPRQSPRMLVFLPGPAWRGRALRIGAVGAGFLAVTLGLWALSRANPFVIWSWNAYHHARFYAEYPRRYLSWVLINPVELAVGLGLPLAVWLALGLDRTTVVSWATLVVLALLTLTGRNLGEVARLWLPFLPGLVFAAGHGLERRAAGPRSLAATVLLTGLQTLILQVTIQVVYPF